MDANQLERWFSLAVEQSNFSQYYINRLRESLKKWETQRWLAVKLVEMNQFVPALKIYEEIINRGMQVSAKDKNFYYQDLSWDYLRERSEIYHNLALLYWETKQDPEKANDYLVEAIRLLQEYDFKYFLLQGGEVWADNLYFSKVLAGEDAALDQAQGKILYLKSQGKVMGPKSCLFYSYLFQAENERDKGNWSQAFQYLREAVEMCCFPKSEQDFFNQVTGQNHLNCQQAYELVEKKFAGEYYGNILRSHRRRRSGNK